MDLVKLSRAAIKNPFHYSNFFVLFITAFIVLLVGFSVLTIFATLTKGAQNTTGCSSQQTRKVSGGVSAMKDGIYQVEFDGDPACTLSATFKWDSPTNVASIWVYNPAGQIEIIEPSVNQTSTTFSENSPVSSGTWRLVVKSKNESNFNYFGDISIK